MNKIFIDEFKKEKKLSEYMQFHSGGLWADYIEWLENLLSTIIQPKIDKSCTSDKINLRKKFERETEYPAISKINYNDAEGCNWELPNINYVKWLEDKLSNESKI